MSGSDHNDERWRCCYIGERGERCHYAGALSHDTRGGDRWDCRFHFRRPDAARGQEIVVESRDWIHGEEMPIETNPPEDAPELDTRLPYVERDDAPVLEPGWNG